MPDDDEPSLGTADEEGDEDGTGSAPSRLLSLCDGVFAIALTLLVLDLAVPEGIKSSDEVNDALNNIVPNFGALVLSFAVIGRYWLAHRSICSNLRKTTDTFLWLNLLFLLPVALMPFTAKLLANYGQYAAPTMIYATNIAVAGLMAFVLGRYAVLRLDRPAYEGSPFSGLSVSVVFLLSIPIALVDPAAAKFFWLLIPVVGVVVRKIEAGRKPTSEVAAG